MQSLRRNFTSIKVYDASISLFYLHVLTPLLNLSTRDLSRIIYIITYFRLNVNTFYEIYINFINSFQFSSKISCHCSSVNLGVLWNQSKSLSKSRSFKSSSKSQGKISLTIQSWLFEGFGSENKTFLISLLYPHP